MRLAAGSSAVLAVLLTLATMPVDSLRHLVQKQALASGTEVSLLEDRHGKLQVEF